MERNHGVHQDRLVKKLRRKGIQGYEAANQYLEAEYLPGHNRRFARVAARGEDYHRKAPSPTQLRGIFRLETERWISNDWVVQYQGRSLQLKPRSRRYGPRQARGLVCEWEDGSMEVRYRGERIAWEEITGAQRPVRVEPLRQREERIRHGWSKPGEDHPWRRGYEERGMRRESNGPAATPVVGMPASASP